MWRKKLLGFMAGVILSACAIGGPPSGTVKEYLEGVSLQEVNIQMRRQCELTPFMVEDGHTNVWLVLYRYKGKDKVYGHLFTETDAGWEPYLMMDACPSP
jgi:hypothetical protein